MDLIEVDGICRLRGERSPGKDHTMAPKPDLGTMLLGTDALSDGAETMRKNVPGVRRGADIEAVHQMRVASRRLRAAIIIFGPVLADARPRRWRRAIRRVTRSLGEARDVDVQIAFVKAFSEKHAANTRVRPGLDRLLLRQKQQRKKMQASVLESMDRFEASGVLDQIGRYARKTIAEGRLARVASGGDVAKQFGRESVRSRLGELLSYDSYVAQRSCAEQLHQMRIVAKWLRYTMDLFVPVLGNSTKSYIKHTKRLQTLLGDLHDMDVWLVTLPRFIASERDRTVEHFGHARGFGRLRCGLEFMLEKCTAQRNRIYATTVNYWGELKADGVWEQLLKICDPPKPHGTLIYPAGGEPPPERCKISIRSR